ncbi:hypothetical protein [Streptomyces sp. NPDC058371]|uniref:hypothetical protein n=1 Tax=Streptomyces sp. NPDC058371 TaxID=3346463 RepID=UPI00365D0268
MSPTPRPPHPLRQCVRARGGARGRVSRAAWLRFLVLLVVALLAAGPHSESLAAVPVAGAAETGGAEHDVLDTALRPPVRQGHRPLAPLRPAPAPDTAHREPAAHPLPVPSPPLSPLALHVLRCVVLRC